MVPLIQPGIGWRPTQVFDHPRPPASCHLRHPGGADWPGGCCHVSNDSSICPQALPASSMNPRKTRTRQRCFPGRIAKHSTATLRISAHLESNFFLLLRPPPPFLFPAIRTAQFPRFGIPASSAKTIFPLTLLPPRCQPAIVVPCRLSPDHLRPGMRADPRRGRTGLRCADPPFSSGKEPCAGSPDSLRSKPRCPTRTVCWSAWSRP